MRTSLLAIILLVSARAATGAQPAPPVRSLVEELRIDGKSHDWKRISTVRVGPGGHILVGEALGKTLRIFSPAGHLVRTIGGRGQGPGEFTNLSAFGVLGDTIWTGDSGLLRLTFFDLTGKVLGTTRIDSGLEQPRDSSGKRLITAQPSVSSPSTLSRDGTGIVGPLVFATAKDTLGNVSIYPYWRTTWRGRIIDTAIAVVLESPLVQIRARDGSRVTYFQNPFPQRQQMALSVDGSRAVLVDAAFAGRDAWSYGVRVTDGKGRQVYDRRYPFGRAPVPARIVDSIHTDLAGQFRNFNVPREALPVPPSYPPVTKAMVATDGSVWLRGRDDPAGAMWTILDPTGSPAGAVREPPRTRFIALDGDLWAVELDEDDVESIVRYRVRPRQGN